MQSKKPQLTNSEAFQRVAKWIFSTALGRNITFVRPTYFIIKGFSGIPNMKYYYIFLLFVFIVSVLGNSAVMAVIYLDQNLKIPKYIAVFNMAFVDLCGSTALVPKVLDTFLFEHQYISYNDCMAYLFFTFMFNAMQSLNLMALSYDRLLAITFPLIYHTLVTNRSMITTVVFFWILAIFCILLLVGLLTRLSFCMSVVINSFYCDHGPLYRMACNDYTPSFVIAYLVPLIILWVPLVFIMITYCCICYALYRISTSQGRRKALKTCTAYLLLVAIYYFPVLITYFLGPAIHPNDRIINLSLTAILPPMLNPIIYVLQTREIKESVKKLFKMTRPRKI